MPDENEIIYHYTSLAGLKGIVESSTLWLTDFHHLNDPTEIRYGISAFANHLFPNSHEDRINFIATQDEALKEKPFYTASFSEQQNYLPAWREYGDDGLGFSIGFSRQALEKEWFSFEQDKPYVQSISGAVSYACPKTFSDSLKDWFAEARAYLETIKKDKAQYQLFHLAINSLIPLLKHPCFQEEKEIRVANSNLCLNGSLTDSPHEVFYRHQNPKQPFIKSIPYISRPIKHSWIKEIWAGPRTSNNHADQEIKKLFTQITNVEEYKIRINHSTLPYKNPEKFFE
ncbi:MAG: hypothetical protein COV52_06040 [Gammaproteobacteria bacterium CG11_big_fil_rev_8_21_14_0_20_46_22]|nr:MAG: hypothetical protein COW05_07620 [Gammaproteobacteria bacterium CG12_big_fil_rev_8_21_14_0_65_46_12]PIR11062.1 MAG: hypothetical protein COV52_06040 [Gammaproteobacteria bacterium CG11_big_fil_rev_8_21_14_0_20_46_22]